MGYRLFLTHTIELRSKPVVKGEGIPGESPVRSERRRDPLEGRRRSAQVGKCRSARNGSRLAPPVSVSTRSRMSPSINSSCTRLPLLAHRPVQASRVSSQSRSRAGRSPARLGWRPVRSQLPTRPMTVCLKRQSDVKGDVGRHVGDHSS